MPQQKKYVYFLNQDINKPTFIVDNNKRQQTMPLSYGYRKACMIQSKLWQ